MEDYVFLDLLSNLIPSSASTLQRLVLRCANGVLDMGDMATIFAPIETTLNVLEYRLLGEIQTEDEWSEGLIMTLGKFRQVRHLILPLPVQSTCAVVAAVQSINGVESITVTSSDSNGINQGALDRLVQLMNSGVDDCGTRWTCSIGTMYGVTGGSLMPDATAHR